MEEVLDIYTEPPTANVPLICMDEASKQLLRDEQPSTPVAPVNRRGRITTTSDAARSRSLCSSIRIGVGGA